MPVLEELEDVDDTVKRSVCEITNGTPGVIVAVLLSSIKVLSNVDVLPSAYDFASKVHGCTSGSTVAPEAVTFGSRGLGQSIGPGLV
jgi:hypothetical protein